MEDVLKAVGKKFPVCNVIDAREYPKQKLLDKCEQKPRHMDIRVNKKDYEVFVCTGNYNVYVLNIEEMCE